MAPADSLPETPRATTACAAVRDFRLLRRLLLASLVLGCAGYLSLNLADPDLWGHTLYGQEWIADGALPRTATHTYTAEGHPWINHENLAELALAVGFPALGVTGMLAAKCLVGMVVLVLMARGARRQRARPVTTWAWLLLVAMNLQPFFLLRPQLLSFLWCALALFVLERAFAGWGSRRSDFGPKRRKVDDAPIDWRWLAALPPLVAVWTNSHGGFVAGLAILSTFLGGRAVQLIARRRAGYLGAVCGLAGVVAACVAATTLNPYGLGLHAWLLGSLGAPRPEITEWDPPGPSTPVFWPLVLLATAAVAALAASRRRHDPVKLVILALVAWQTASHLRHIAFFALLCGFWLPPHVQSAVDRFRGRSAGGFSRVRLNAATRWVAFGALTAAIAVQTLSLGQRLASLPVERTRYPVDALQWMAEQGVRGKLVVAFNWAQYAVAALVPDVRVSCDGRFRTCYPQEAVDRHFDFLIGEFRERWRAGDGGAIDGSRELVFGAPDYVLIDRAYPNPTRIMAEADPKEWALVYQDGIAQVWGRRSVVDDAESPRRIAPEARFVSDHYSRTSVEWPALPRRRMTAAEALGELALRDDHEAPATPAGG